VAEDHAHELEDTHGHGGHGETKKSGDGIGVLLPIVVLVLIIGGVIAGSYLLDEGEPEPPSDPMALIASAPEAIEDAETAHMTMSMEMAGGEGGGGAGGGLPDEMSMSAEGDVDYTSGDASIEMSFFGMTMEMRIVDETMYQRMPAMMRPSGIDEEWLGLPLEAAGAAGLNPLGTAPNGADMVEMLRGISGELEELGSAEVNGVDAWGYRAMLDLTEALDEMSAEERIEANISSGMLGSMGMDEVPIEVWITEDGLPVRMVMEMEEDALFAMTMQIDFTDFGAPVSIEAPPAEEVHVVEDLDELEELMGESIDSELSSEIELDYAS
jgi:hypothetical protein